MNTLVTHYLQKAAWRYPDAGAVIFQGRQYNYQALDELSDHIALGLEEQGVKPGDNIGMYLQKSALALAAIYGVLKTGACYVPMPVSDPASRTAYLLKNSGAQYLLVANPVNKELAEMIHAEQVTQVDINSMVAQVEKAGKRFTAKAIHDQAVAAVLHTSGSTGAPKGVMITHANLAVFLDWAVKAFALNPNDRLLSHAPWQFDLSFFDIFAAVAAGACVVLAEPHDTSCGVRMARLVETNEVTVWQSVPSALTLQTVSGLNRVMPSVRQVLFAGEPMPRQTLVKLPGLFPNARLHNIYGCTETNDTFMYSLPENIEQAPDPLPIGYVLPFIRYRIVDDNNQDLKPGQPGHLLVAGATVMAGYLGITDPSRFTDDYYRTNDLVSQTDQGLLQFHGRIDSVVKTNGYRVNLTEIEDFLLRSGQFKEVALFSEQDHFIGQRIIATVRPLDDAHCSVLSLKIYCARGLPSYAIPHSFYITAQELPKGSTGKIDRRTLANWWKQQQGVKNLH